MVSELGGGEEVAIGLAISTSEETLLTDRMLGVMMVTGGDRCAGVTS